MSLSLRSAVTGAPRRGFVAADAHYRAADAASARRLRLPRQRARAVGVRGAPAAISASSRSTTSSTVDQVHDAGDARSSSVHGRSAAGLPRNRWPPARSGPRTMAGCSTGRCGAGLVAAYRPDHRRADRRRHVRRARSRASARRWRARASRGTRAACPRPTGCGRDAASVRRCARHSRARADCGRRRSARACHGAETAWSATAA